MCSNLIMKGDNIMSKKSSKWVKSLQTFSKAMMSPVLFLPVIGLVLAFSSILTNPSLISNNSIANIGQLIGDTFWPLFGNLGLIFAVGLAYGLAKYNKSEAAMVALMSYIMFLGANSSFLSLIDSVAEPIEGQLVGTGQAIVLGFQVVDMGIFLGILLGGMVAYIHNRFVLTELKGVLSVYGGAKLVLIILTPIIIIFAIVCAYVWPLVASGIESLTGIMKSSGAGGIFVYGFFEKFLIPTGLHHFVWSPFQLTSIGGTIIENGQTISGSQPIFLAYMRNPNISELMHESLRFSQQGMVTIFGLPGAALAFYKTASPAKRSQVKALLIPAITTSILVGITEPIEFTFLFLSPLLWVVHAVLTALSQVVCYLLDVRPWGASGLIEFIIYNIPLPASLTRWPLYVAIGVVQFFVYFFIFKYLILKLNLKTPGREDDHENVHLYSKEDYKKAQSTQIDDQSALIVKGLGGIANIISINNCYTRLRVEVYDMELIDETILSQTGSKGIIRKGNEAQVVYGLTVGSIKSKVDKFIGKSE